MKTLVKILKRSDHGLTVCARSGHLCCFGRLRVNFEKKIKRDPYLYFFYFSPSKIFYFKNILTLKNFLTFKNFSTLKIFSTSKIFNFQKFFHSKNFFTLKKFSASKIFYPQKLFTLKIFFTFKKFFHSEKKHKERPLFFIFFILKKSMRRDPYFLFF